MEGRNTAFKHGVGVPAFTRTDSARKPPRVAAHPRVSQPPQRAHARTRTRGGAWEDLGGGGGNGSTGLPSPTASGCRGGEEARPTGSGPRIKSRIITVLIKIKGRRERTHSIKENGKNGSGGGEVPPEAVVPSTHPTFAVGVPGLRPPLLSPHSGTPGTARPLRTAPHRTSLGLSPRARPRAHARARTRRTPHPPTPSACTPAVLAPALHTGRGGGGRETQWEKQY